MSLYLMKICLQCLCSRKCTLCFCALSICMFVFRLGLVMVTVSDPCEYYRGSGAEQGGAIEPGRPGGGKPFSVCLSASEIFFRFLLTCVTGVIIAGHFLALLFEDRILIGMVIGAEWLNVSSELISKAHAVWPLLAELDLSTFGMTFGFFIVEFLTALSLVMWVVSVRCKSRRHNHHDVCDGDESPRHSPRAATLTKRRRTTKQTVETECANDDETVDGEVVRSL